MINKIKSLVNFQDKIEYMHSSLSPIFNELQKSMVELLEDIKDQPDSVLNEVPSRGGWSILQVVYHIVLVEEASLAYMKKKLSFGDDIPKAGFKAWFRSVYLKVFFVLPVKIKAPAIISVENMPAEIRFWEVLKKWKDVRLETEEFLDQMPDHLLKTELFKHALVGKMTPKSMLQFFHLHFARHRKQLNRILKEVRYVV